MKVLLSGMRWFDKRIKALKVPQEHLWPLLFVCDSRRWMEWIITGARNWPGFLFVYYGLCTHTLSLHSGWTTITISKLKWISIVCNVDAFSLQWSVFAFFSIDLHLKHWASLICPKVDAPPKMTTSSHVPFVFI